MKKRILAAFLAAMMVLSLAGCGSADSKTTAAPTEAPATEAPATEAKTTEAPATEAPATEAPTTEAPTTEAPTTEAPATEAPATEAPSAEETTEAPSQEESLEDVTKESGETEALQELALLDFMSGGLKPLTEEDEAEVSDLSEEDQAEMDRAMRAYTPGSDTLLRNDARDFYYYSQMEKDAQILYDAMLMVAEDPTDTNNIVKAVISTDPSSRAFSEVYTTAYYGMLYDHAELFWLYNAVEDDFQLGRPRVDDAPAGRYSVYIKLLQPYANYQKEVTAFNDAVDAFLADINPNQPDAQIAKDIHDKLIEMVTYNMPVMQDGTSNGFKNLAHTAYGALVADNDGTPNYAVCDGYSQAYVYLLQQMGINAAVIVGVAGSDAASAGGHAWTAVQLDGDWYEVDSTWDDMGTKDAQIDALQATDPYSYAYYHEAAVDPAYRDLMQHYLFNVTTDTMSNFMPDYSYVYTSKDGRYAYSLCGPCVHIRATTQMRGYAGYGYAVRLAPTATGTLYSYR